MNNKDGSISAPKGYGKQNKGCKNNKGKATGGKGKNYFNGKRAKGYRSPGKGIGKGLNDWGEDDYTAAWGNEME